MTPKFENFWENDWKSMKFGIEDSNLHSFRQGIRISNRWRLVLMKNIKFSAKSDIFRELEMTKFSDWHATGAIFLKFCGPAGCLAPWREHAPPRKDSKWLVETENPFSSRRVILYRNKSEANRAAKWLVNICWKISQKWAYLLIQPTDFAEDCPELRKNV